MPRSEEILAAVESLAIEPVRDDELQRTITAFYASMAATAETARRIL